jgi:nucleoside-diphosphate-sugar epimerase
VLGPGDLNLISGRFITEIRRLQWTIPVTSGGISVVDVRDVARWHLAAAERGRTGERYILSAANYSFREWYALIAEVVGVARPVMQVPDFLLPPLAALIDSLTKLGLALPVDANQTRLGGRFLYFDNRKGPRRTGRAADRHAPERARHLHLVSGTRHHPRGLAVSRASARRAADRARLIRLLHLLLPLTDRLS